RDRKAAEPRGGGHHRQGLRARTQDRRDDLVAPERWCARRDAEQVRALGRPAVTVGAAVRAPRRVLFVTGKLAEPALRRPIAEVNNAPRLARDAIRREAQHYRTSGADVIDIGCTPGREFPGLGDVVRELVGEGMRVSIDSFDPDEIRTAVAAGAELVLSVNASNREVARALAGSKTRVVVIPDFGQGLETLEPSVAALEQWGVSYLIDPVIEPIGFG